MSARLRDNPIARVARGVAVCVVAAGPALAQRSHEPVPLRARMLAVEDARPQASDQPPSPAAIGSREPGAGSLPDPLTPLFEGLTSLPEMQVMAVRALGRLERPDLVPRIAVLLTATSASVRAEAANALAQAVVRGEPSPVFERLRARTGIEADPAVRGVLARSLGRLPYKTPAEVDAAQAAMLAVLDPPPSSSSSSARAAVAPPSSAGPHAPALVTVLGVVHGLESLARRTSTIEPLGDTARLRLAQLARLGLDPAGAEVLVGTGRDEARRVRRLSVGALTAGGGVPSPVVTGAVADPDSQVRRLGVLAAGRASVEPRTRDVLDAALVDADPRVRIEALRQRAEAGGRVGCQAAKLAMADANTHVALTAIDAVGRLCQADPAAVDALDILAVPPASDPTSGAGGWHRPAHALVSLARLMPGRTRARLARFASHPDWPVRLYAARAAGLVGATSTIETLARDVNDNVADAALAELSRLAGHRADAFSIAALARTDGQIVRDAARALAGTPRREDVTRELLAALARVTIELRETSRDVRLAILDRLAETGAALPATRDELAVYVTDFDPVVAARVAALLTSWRGTVVRAQPRPLPRMPLPSLERLAVLRNTTAVVTMARGGAFRLRLFADEAPTNVARFARLSSSGYFDRLSFHRVEPTFVIQGGSPHANEYAGDGPYTRDEVGLRSHLRGTVGISTRGRDTGDGQIFVNLVDNVRLDHNYTIIGEVIDGLDVVDGILEGDVIRDVRLVRGSSADGRR